MIYAVVAVANMMNQWLRTYARIRLVFRGAIRSGPFFLIHLLSMCILCGHESPPAQNHDELKVRKTNSLWSGSVEMIPGPGGRLVPAVKLAFANYSIPENGSAVHVDVPVRLPAAGHCRLTFRMRRAPLFRAAGYQFLRLEMNGSPLLERDVARISEFFEPVQIDLPGSPNDERTVLSIRMSSRKIADDAQSGYPVAVWIVNPEIETGKGDIRLLGESPVRTEEPVPPDLPLPSLPVNGERWTRTACILQPWGRSEMEIVKHAAEQIPWLKQRFGFNAVTLLPPAAHNAISAGWEISDAEFEDALRLFRAHGFRIILYSSIMHCGHDPVWQDGTLARTHPEWSQRGPEGEPITIYGQQWLCPSSGALEFTIAYTRRMVGRFRPDAVILDNNEFYVTPSGLSCHCAGCRKGFREYLSRRFGETVFGQPVRSVLIPRDVGPLYSVWLQWRNRVWAEATETFRTELRRVKSDVVVSANTQYLFFNNSLATDRQFEHEDVVISESTGLDLDGLVDKMLLGRALANDRPLWNYLGTFQGNDISRLQPPEVVSMNISATVASLARPWVVYYGFLENQAANRSSLERMAALLNWHNGEDLPKQREKPYAPVLSLVSQDSFNFLGRPLIPPHLARLRRLGICSSIIEERTVSRGTFASCRALLIEEAPCLAENSISRIVEFVSSGGILIARSDAGSYDEIGRLRPISPLWKRLGLTGKLAGRLRFGRGVAIPFDGGFPLAETATRLEFARFRLEPAVDAVVLPYWNQMDELRVYVCSELPLPSTLKIIAPGALRGHAVVCSSGQRVPLMIPLSRP